MNWRVALLIILVTAMTPAAALADWVFEDWNDGDLGGWIQNTSETVLVWVSSGGVDDSGYLCSYETPNGFNIAGAQQHNEPYVGDYGAHNYTRVQCALRFYGGVFSDVWFRVRYLSATYNGWHISLTDSFTPGEWRTATIKFNPLWPDAEAIAAGWVQESTSASFQETMANVWSAEVRAMGSGTLEISLDNFLLADETVPVESRSWSEVKALYR